MPELVEASGDSGGISTEDAELRVGSRRNLTSDSWLLQLDSDTRRRLESLAERNNCPEENVIAAAARVLEILARLKDNDFEVGFKTGPNEWRPIRYTV